MTTADFMRMRRASLEELPPRATIETMPFIGHRTQQTIRVVGDAAMIRWGPGRLAREYGLGPQPYDG